MASVTLNVDGQTHELDVDPDMPLLYALRNDLEMKNPRFGCGLAQCGACTVMMDGEAIRSCVTPVSTATGEIRTLNKLGTDDAPHPVQAAFIEEQASFCGFCINGWIMYSVAMLERDPDVTEDQIVDELADLKCRCGSHDAVLRAVKRAAETMKA